MNYEQLQTMLANAPAIKLLRAKNAPLIASFLYKEFKETHRLTIPNYELVDKLADHLLVEKLNRILSGQSTLERKRAVELIAEIKRYAL